VENFLEKKYPSQRRFPNRLVTGRGYKNNRKRQIPAQKIPQSMKMAFYDTDFKSRDSMIASSPDKRRKPLIDTTYNICENFQKYSQNRLKQQKFNNLNFIGNA